MKPPNLKLSNLWLTIILGLGASIIWDFLAELFKPILQIIHHISDDMWILVIIIVLLFVIGKIKDLILTFINYIQRLTNTYANSIQEIKKIQDKIDTISKEDRTYNYDSQRKE